MTTNDPDQGVVLQVGGDPANEPVAQTAEFGGLLVRLVRQYLSEADRTARMSSFLENSISGLADVDRLEVWDTANHISLYHRSLYSVTRGTNQTLTSSSTTLQPVTNITVALPAAGRFHWRTAIWASSPTTGDIKYAYTSPGGSSMRWGLHGLEATAGTTFTAASTTISGAALPVGCLGAGTNTLTLIEGEITMGGAGNLILEAAQNTSDPGVTNIALVRQELWREV